MSGEQTNTWRELTDEEIEMASGGIINSAAMHVGFLQAVEGLADIIAGNVTHNQDLRNEGLFDLGLIKGI